RSGVILLPHIPDDVLVLSFSPEIENRALMRFLAGTVINDSCPAHCHTAPCSAGLALPDLLSADYRIAIIGTVFTSIDASMRPNVRTAKNSIKGRARAVIMKVK